MSTNTSNRPNRAYKLVPYDPNWMNKFEVQAKNLAPIFGNNLVKIEHIGSTSVPGMLAKPQIDMLVVVKDLSQVKDIYSSMSSQGFKAFGDYIQKADPEEYFAQDNNQGERLFSVHVMQEGSFEVEDSLTFRDYLRANDAARDAYITHKRYLMTQFTGKDYNSYGKGKIDFLENLKAKARKWHKNIVEN